MKAKFILTLFLVTNIITMNYAQRADSLSEYRLISIKAGIILLNEINLGTIINPTHWLGLGFDAGYKIPFRNEAYTPTSYIDFPAFLSRPLTRSGYIFRNTIYIRPGKSVVFPSLAFYFTKSYSKRIIDDPGRSTGTTMSSYREFNEKYTAIGGEARINVMIGKFAYLYTGFGLRKKITEDHYYLSGSFNYRKSVDYTLKKEINVPAISMGINFLIRK